MVGIPGTEERLALADIEDRLRRIRARFNLYTFQHHLYRLGAALSLGIAALILGAFLLPPWIFTLAAWPVLTVLAFLTLFFLRRSVVDWSDVMTSARRIDMRAGLKERLSTLVAQLTAGVIGKEPPSSLWSQLLTDNLNHLSDWEVKKVAPSRIPWSCLPFLVALALVLFIASVPMLSSVHQPEPFSLDNLRNVLADLPDRLDKMMEERSSLLPDAPEQWGNSSLFGDKQPPKEGNAAQPQNSGKETNQPESRSLASLPEELQKKIREALKGLEIKEEEKKEPGNVPSDEKQVALRPSDASSQKASDASMQGKDPSGKNQQAAGGGGGKGTQGKGNGPSAESGGGAQAPAQGSGLQQLDRARLDRKNARGQFQPNAPQAPQVGGRGGESGEGGPGAGSGTDPHVLGKQTEMGGGSRSFQLALDATHERVQGENPPEAAAKDEGGIIEKSTKSLSQRQSLDDAIRKSQVPPEYEEIVKRLFSRGDTP
jgi:hypothetical protein